MGFHPCLVGTDRHEEMFSERLMLERYHMIAHRYVFPTMQDLKDEVDHYIEHEMTYEGEVKGNIRGAIKARIDSLCVGSKGYMFNNHDMVDMDSLLKRDSVLELEGLADDADKAFALGLLIIYINEYRQVKKEVGSVKGLQHLLVIEEAHRLLRNVSTENKEDLGNPKGKAVEHFTNMLAEMRSYGQGVIVSEQIPSKLAPDVIKNSSNKIIHRIIAKDDQEIMASTVGIYPEDAIYMGSSRVGYALCHKEGMVQPVAVKIDEVGNNIVTDTRLYNRDIDKKIGQINKSIIATQLGEDIDVWSVRLMVSLLYNPSADKLYDGLDVACEQILHGAAFKAITLIPGVNRKKCILDCLADSVVSLMIAGVFSNKKLPDDELSRLIHDVVQVPTVEKIKQLQEKMEVFYKKKPANKAIVTLARLFGKDFASGRDLTEVIMDFGVYKNAELAAKVIEYLKKGV